MAKKRKPVRLHLGGGAWKLPGYVNIDRKLNKEGYPLDYPDESVDEIRASHILEHFPHGLTVTVLRDWARALRPGGVLRISVPDVARVITVYNDPTSAAPVEGYLMGGQTDGNDFHFTIFNERKLWMALHEVGLTDIREWHSDIADCAAMPISLNLQGTKPLPGWDLMPLDTRLNVTAGMSVPRLGFMANYFSAYQACLPLGIKLRMVEGAYWHQALEECLEDIVEVETPPDLIMTVDYDSIFEKRDVQRLMRIMVDHPEIDALCPIQMRRNNPYPLLTMKTQNAAGNASTATWATFAPISTQISTGHFGLTMIRVSSLLEVGHPWFIPQPNKDGRWRDGRVDADVYFWKNWEKHGKTLHLANHVVIGHCELMVSWPGKDLKPTHQHIEDYNLNGRPAHVWR